MTDPLLEQLTEFMEPQEARRIATLVKMAVVLMQTNTENAGLKARVKELEAAAASA